jgi:hypothetical protein
MSEEIELASKSAGEVAGQVADVLVEKSGVTEPTRAVFRAVATALDAAFYPALLSFCQRAATKMEARGLSRRAVETLPPRLLRGILEEGAMEQDETLEGLWANLLGNLATASAADVRRAFPKILASLEPDEARLLEEVRASLDQPTGALTIQTPNLDMVTIDNLTRSELIESLAGPVYDQSGETLRVSVTLTALGRAFVDACREPQPASVDGAEV